MDNAKRFKIAAFTPAQFLVEQVMGMNPLLAPIWIAGLLWLVVPGRGARYRVLGLAYAVVLLLLMFQRAKPYYAFPAYVMLFAAGGCAIEGLLHRLQLHWARPAVAAWITLGGAISVPLTVPVLSPGNLLRYQSAIGAKQTPEERGPAADLPQYFADRFGWENLSAVVASVYRALPDAEKESCLIIGSNCGETGAINYFGPAHGLPRAYSVHNNHYFWGPPPTEPAVVIHIGGSRGSLERFCDQVSVAAVVQSEFAMPYETNLPVYVCRGMRMPLREAWRASKKFI